MNSLRSLRKSLFRNGKSVVVPRRLETCAYYLKRLDGEFDDFPMKTYTGVTLKNRDDDTIEVKVNRSIKKTINVYWKGTMTRQGENLTLVGGSIHVEKSFYLLYAASIVVPLMMFYAGLPENWYVKFIAAFLGSYFVFLGFFMIYLRAELSGQVMECLGFQRAAWRKRRGKKRDV